MRFGEIPYITNMKKKIVTKIIILFVLLIGVSLGLWVYINQYLVKSKATEEIVKMQFSPPLIKAHEGDTIQTNLILTIASSTNTTLGISGIDLSFINTGKNLEFLYSKTTAPMPNGLEDNILDEATMTTATEPKQLKRMVFVSPKSSGQLQKSIIIPLYFKVLSAGQTAFPKNSGTIDTSLSEVVGSQGHTYSISLDENASSFTVELFGPKSTSATNLACDSALNKSNANCGRGIAITWTDATNEEGYKIYRNDQLVRSVGKDANSFNDQWCANFTDQTYSVMAYNEAGSVEEKPPAITCACQICPTASPPTPTLEPPMSSADLIFRVIFPDALPSIQEIPNVKIIVLDNERKHICSDGIDCAQVVTFRRVQGAKIANTFQSPHLKYDLTKNQAYIIEVKHINTVKQSYAFVYLKWQKILQCLEGTKDSGCGQLIEDVTLRPLFSGDLDGSNVIDQVDLDKVGISIGGNSAQGDLNFDGITDQKDIEVIGKNFNKKGT